MSMFIFRLRFRITYLHIFSLVTLIGKMGSDKIIRIRNNNSCFSVVFPLKGGIDKAFLQCK